jgi:DNA-binding winged helix-turn-helix (wHTH) protein
VKRTRAAAVLHVLAERAEQLVTKEELFDRVWGGLAVTDDALTSSIQELRGVLGDDARRPRCIETRHRRGYRLMMPATASVEHGAGLPAPTIAPAARRLVRRVGELEALAAAFDDARQRRRRLVFLTGEPGIGKSALANAFLARALTLGPVRIAHGQCLDHHGVGEP